MIYTEEINCRKLNIIVQNDFDWLQMFDDLKQRNEMPIVLNEDNMDFFYPNWRTEFDPGNIPDTLDELVANRFDYISIVFSEGVTFDVGEGRYEVTAFSIAFPCDEEQHKFDIPAEGKVLAKLFYQVSPDLPVS
jgi:hypothetical protein